MTIKEGLSGLTAPNSSAKVDLIWRTYTIVGLDLGNPSDRCQYFESHGAGTKVGVLKEVSAIHSAFFGTSRSSCDQKLYVGGVKTVIGHSEGAAGLADLLKAMFAIQHGVIPPNLHSRLSIRSFNRSTTSLRPPWNE